MYEKVNDLSHGSTVGMVAQRKQSGLLSFSFRKFKSIHDLKSVRQLDSDWSLCCQVKGEGISVYNRQSNWMLKYTFWKSEIWSSGSKLIAKRIGPKMEPWGTPCNSGATVEKYSPCGPKSFCLTDRTVPMMPSQCLQQVKRIIWSTAPTAALRFAIT